jgi:hypothetical protein
MRAVDLASQCENKALAAAALAVASATFDVHPNITKALMGFAGTEATAAIAIKAAIASGQVTNQEIINGSYLMGALLPLASIPIALKGEQAALWAGATLALLDIESQTRNSENAIRQR